MVPVDVLASLLTVEGLRKEVVEVHNDNSSLVRDANASLDLDIQQLKQGFVVFYLFSNLPGNPRHVLGIRTYSPSNSHFWKEAVSRSEVDVSILRVHRCPSWITASLSNLIEFAPSDCYASLQKFLEDRVKTPASIFPDQRTWRCPAEARNSTQQDQVLLRAWGHHHLDTRPNTYIRVSQNCISTFSFSTSSG
jgi:hypothetical protein